MVRIHSAPFRTVLRWQVVTTAVVAIVTGLLAGVHGALSGALGGMVALVACLGFAIVTQIAKTPSIGTTLMTAFRAEGVKIGVSVVLLWLVLATYKQVVAVAFIGSFAISILVFSMAVFVRDVGRNSVK